MSIDKGTQYIARLVAYYRTPKVAMYRKQCAGGCRSLLITVAANVLKACSVTHTNYVPHYAWHLLAAEKQIIASICYLAIKEAQRPTERHSHVLESCEKQPVG
jgi:hypothetical protein